MLADLFTRNKPRTLEIEMRNIEVVPLRRSSTLLHSSNTFHIINDLIRLHSLVLYFLFLFQINFNGALKSKVNKSNNSLN